MSQTKRRNSKQIPKKAGSKSARNTTKIYKRVLPIGILLGSAIFVVIAFSYGLSYIINNNISKPYRIVPEHERFMKKVVISLGTKRATLDLHNDLLHCLPDYSEIIVLLPKSSLQPIKDELEDQPFSQRTKLIGFDTKYLTNERVYLVFPERDKLMDSGPLKASTVPRGSLWAQDLFEVATKPDGQILLLISDLHKWFTSYESAASLNVVSDNTFLGCLHSVGIELKRLPLTFMGGNILVDEYNNRRIAICGGDVFRLTRTVWKSTRESTPTDAQITKMLKQFLNVDEVVVVGKERVQPSMMFHLDQAMVFFPNGVVGITHIVEKGQITIQDAKEVNEVELFLSELRSVLLRLGYSLVNIETSIHNIVNYQYFVNGIPYVDAITGQRTYLMPVYPSAQTELEKGLIKKNTATFKSLGYRVVHVPSKADKFNGGIHCLVNVLE